MRFTRLELTKIIQPHVLRSVVRLQGRHGADVTAEQVRATGLTEEEIRALVQTRRLEETEPGRYRILV